MNPEILAMEIKRYLLRLLLAVSVVIVLMVITKCAMACDYTPAPEAVPPEIKVIAG